MSHKLWYNWSHRTRCSTAVCDNWGGGIVPYLKHLEWIRHECSNRSLRCGLKFVMLLLFLGAVLANLTQVSCVSGLTQTGGIVGTIHAGATILAWLKEALIIFWKNECTNIVSGVQCKVWSTNPKSRQALVDFHLRSWCQWSRKCSCSNIRLSHQCMFRRCCKDLVDSHRNLEFAMCKSSFQ